MRITIKFDNGRKLVAHNRGEEYATCSQKCPHGCQDDGPKDECGAYHGAKGTITMTDRDTMGQAICYWCRKPVGVIKVVFDTLFGIEEDARVLSGRARVY